MIVHENAQVAVQDNSCDNTAITTACINTNENFFNATSSQDAVDTEASNVQVGIQSNNYTDSPLCENVGPNIDLVQASGNALVHSEDTQLNFQSNGCLAANPGTNDNTNFNSITANDSSKLTSGKDGTTSQIALQDNSCLVADCNNFSTNINAITTSGDSKAKSTTSQVVDQGTPGSVDTGNRCARRGNLR